MLRHHQQQLLPPRIIASLAGLIYLYLTTDCQDDEAVLALFEKARALDSSEQVSFILGQRKVMGSGLERVQQRSFTNGSATFKQGFSTPR